MSKPPNVQETIVVSEIGKPIWKGVPQNGRCSMENPIKMDDLGIPLFQETSICVTWPKFSATLIFLEAFMTAYTGTRHAPSLRHLVGTLIYLLCWWLYRIHMLNIAM